MKNSLHRSITPGMIVRMFADAAMIQAALVASLALRLYWGILFDKVPVNIAAVAADYTDVYFRTSWPLTLLALVVFYFNGFYTYGRFYQGRFKALVVTQAVCQTYLVFGFLTYFVSGTASATQSSGQIQFPRGALLAAWILTLFMMVGSRLWQHMWRRFVHPEQESMGRLATSNENLVLVIGGAGYIGSAMLPKLLERGYQVRLLDMLMFGEKPIEKFLDHPNLEIIQGDFRHVENVVEAMQGVNTVVHLGAIVGDPACSLDEDLTIDVNLSATRMLAELAKAAGVERFVFASTCSVYGACNEMLDEHSSCKPVSLYGHTKLASEKVLHRMATDHFKPTIVRFATIYGFSGRTRFDLVVNVLSAKAKIDGVITIQGGDQWRPFVHVDDAARGVVEILGTPLELVEGQVFNIGSNDQNYTISQIGELVHQQVVTAELEIDDQATDPRNYRVDFSKIRNLVGFSPQWTVEEGIQQVLEAIASGDVVDYQDSQYSNLKSLTETGTSSLNRNGWAHELIRAATAEEA